MLTGTIKTVFVEKGFGFIQDAQGTDYFFHRSGVRGVRLDALQVGMPVTFEREEGGAKGPRADAVRVVVEAT